MPNTPFQRNIHPHLLTAANAWVWDHIGVRGKGALLEAEWQCLTCQDRDHAKSQVSCLSRDVKNLPPGLRPQVTVCTYHTCRLKDSLWMPSV